MFRATGQSRPVRDWLAAAEHVARYAVTGMAPAGTGRLADMSENIYN